jgi:hypothetical protein
VRQRDPRGTGVADRQAIRQARVWPDHCQSAERITQDAKPLFMVIVGIPVKSNGVE